MVQVGKSSMKTLPNDSCILIFFLILFLFKNLLNLAIDVYLLMCVEGQHLEPFLESCSNELWFSNISIVLKNVNTNSNSSVGQTISNLSTNSANIDVKLVEKMSLLLQKLSKIKYYLAK
jgi:hypothetical protein